MLLKDRHVRSQIQNPLPESLDPQILDPQTLDPQTLDPQTLDPQTREYGARSEIRCPSL